jgi:hypothetical protein
MVNKENKGRVGNMNNVISTETTNLNDIIQAIKVKYGDRIKDLKFISETNNEWYFSYRDKETNKSNLMKVYVIDELYDFYGITLAVKYSEEDNIRWKMMV